MNGTRFLYDPRCRPNDTDGPLDALLLTSAAWGLPWVSLGEVTGRGGGGGGVHTLSETCLYAVAV